MNNMKAKKLIVKFEVTVEIDASDMIGDSLEEKLENFKGEIDCKLFNSLENYKEASFGIECVKESVEKYG